MEDLTRVLNAGAESVVRELIRGSRFSPRSGAFFARFLLSARSAARKREKLERAGEHVPPFLIASITRHCNLRCAGCYDRHRACGHDRSDLSAREWRGIFDQAREMGVSFILLAGGEPLLRTDVLEAAAGTGGILFPVFTNGTLLEGAALRLFDEHRNLVPVLSVEGGAAETGARRGEGVYERLLGSMAALKARGIPFGASVTVTRQNLGQVAAGPFVDDLYERGARAVVYVEYVPVDGNDRASPEEAERRALTHALSALREGRKMLFLSFPGDEAALSGCLAAGRGFFHIASDGAAEPCPFSPHSDLTLRDHTLREALASPLFRRLRDGGVLNLPHAGGCALFQREELVARMARE